MRIISVILFLLIPAFSQAQQNFIVTINDSIFHGYVRPKSIEGVPYILFTEDKKKAPKKYRREQLKYYSYKKDTFAIFQNFYPFPDDTEPVDIMEARLLISKGALKLYFGMMPILSDKIMVTPIVTPTGVGAMVQRIPYATYIVKDGEGQLHAVRHAKDGFKDSILSLVGDDEELAEMINSGVLKYDDIEKIIAKYNKDKGY